MATVKLNIKSDLQRIRSRISETIDKEKLFRPVCLDLVVLMTERIHIKGEKTDGSLIGEYSEKYKKRRQSKKYNRIDNDKIVFALTSQLENGWAVVATQRGYGIGFTDKRNYDLVKILDVKYPNVFKLSNDEKKYALDFINDLVKEKI